MSDSFADILKIFLTYLLKQIDQNQQEKVLLIILFCVIIIISIGCLIGWILAKRKLKIEISKLNAESKKTTMENYEKLQGYRKTYLDSSILTQMATSEITQNFKSDDVSSLRSNILEYRDLIFNELIESLEKYCEVYEILYKEEKRKFANLAKEEFFLLITTVDSIIDIINMEVILDKTGLEKCILDKNLYNRITRVFYHNLPWYCLYLKYKIHKKIKMSFEINSK